VQIILSYNTVFVYQFPTHSKQHTYHEAQLTVTSCNGILNPSLSVETF